MTEPTAKGLLTLKQICEKLNVSQSWVYKKVAARIIPHFKIGGTIRFSEKDVFDWLEKHHVSGCQKV